METIIMFYMKKWVIMKNQGKNQPKKTIDKIKKRTKKIYKNLSINLQYVNDKRRHKYNDIYNFLQSDGESGNGIYPEYIYSIEDKKQRKN